MYQDLSWLHSFESPIYIYELIDPRDGVPKYIGKTNDIKRRYKEHLSYHTCRDRTIKNLWIRKLKKNNLKPSIRIIAIAKDNTVANLIEINKIKEYKQKNIKLKNGTEGGDGTTKGWSNFQYKIKCIPVVGVCIKTQKIVEFRSVTDASRFVKVGSSQISFCCKKKKGFLTAGGYYWYYKKDFNALSI